MHQVVAQQANHVGLKLKLLGEFRVESETGQIGSTVWRRRLRAGQLLMLLSLAPRQTMHKEEVIEHLWPGQRRDAALNNLRVARHLARTVVRDLIPNPRQIVASEGAQLVLHRSGLIWTDVVAFESTASQARRSSDPDMLDAAIDLYEGDLLPDQQYEEWTIARRNALQQTCLQLLIQRAMLLSPDSELERIVTLLDRALALDELNERAYFLRMRAYASVGQFDRAIDEYRQLKQALEFHIGVGPDSAVTELLHSIQNGTFRKAETQHPVRLALPDLQREPRDNLPIDHTRLIGRQAEIEQVCVLIRCNRLVTVTGPGGSGKTRIAIKAAAALADQFPDGVWLVQLASIDDPNLVVPAIAASLNIKEVPGTPLRERLLSELANRNLLLILDNCEHLIETCASLVQDFLYSCYDIRVLTTSREALRLDSEVTWITPPLSLPSMVDRQPEPDADALPESVQLFLDRARINLDTYASSRETIAGVAEICQRMEGMPLAIELAAARTEVLSIPELLDRLDDALNVLRSASRSVPARHQTLRATLAWSYELLDSDEQALFRRLSVVPGGFELGIATFLMPSHERNEMTVIDGLASLFNKSLLMRSVTETGSVRFRMLETVRQFGQELLVENGELRQTEHRFISWFETALMPANDALVGPEQVAWLEWLDREHDNLRRVLQLCIVDRHSRAALNLIWGIWRFWEARGYLEEGRSWIERVLEIGDPLAHGLERARVLLGLGILRRRQGAIRDLEPLLDECLALAREVGDDETIMAALTQLGHLAREQGDYQRAMTSYEETLRVRTELGDYWGMTVSCAGLGQTAMLRGDLHAAEEWYRRSLELRQQLEDHTGIARALGQLGDVARARGDADLAHERLSLSLVMYREVGNPIGAASVLASLACLEIERGSGRAAKNYLVEAFALAQQAGADREVINVGENVVEVIIAQELFTEAATLLSAIEQYSERRNVARSASDIQRLERKRAHIRSELGTESFNLCWLKGRSFDLEGAIAQVLG